MKRFYVAATLLLVFGSLTVLGQIKSEKQKQEEAEARRTEFLKKAPTLVPSGSERAKYADFLKTPNSGLIRLLPREKYFSEAYGDTLKAKTAKPETVGSFARKKSEDLTSSDTSTSPTQPAFTNVDDVPRVDPVKPRNTGGWRDGGAYYSFSRLTHEYNYGSDLALERGQFHVGFAGADYGFLTDLGDVPLESISLDTPAAKSLAAYARAGEDADARVEYRRFKQGDEIDGVKVKSSLPMQLHSTYLLRAINYRQADVLVAFKVVEIDADGSPLILWKRLKRYSTPLLGRKDL